MIKKSERRSKKNDQKNPILKSIFSKTNQKEDPNLDQNLDQKFYQVVIWHLWHACTFIDCELYRRVKSAKITYLKVLKVYQAGKSYVIKSKRTR